MADVASMFDVLQSDKMLTPEQMALLEHFPTTFSSKSPNVLVQSDRDANWRQIPSTNDMVTASEDTFPTSMPLPMPQHSVTESMQNSMLPGSSASIPQYLIPDQSMGPSFDPRIGWYFPAIALSETQTPRGLFPVSEGHDPMSSISLGITNSDQTQLPAKSKYGPAKFLPKQAKGRLDSARKSSTPQSFEITKNTPLAKHCVCTDKEANKVKRPKNAWILYRSANAPKIARSLGSHSAQAISRLASQQWKNESVPVRQKYFDMARQEKARHVAMHPDYKYQPGSSNRYKFGSVSCTCGAYQANMAALGITDLPEDEALDSYPCVGSSGQRKAPTAPMVKVPPAPLPKTSSYGLDIDPEEPRAVERATKLQCKREGSEVFTEQDDQTMANRRSGRQRKSVIYTESSEYGLFEVAQTNIGQPFTDTRGAANLSTVNLDDLYGKAAYGLRSGSLKNRVVSPTGAFDFDFDNVSWQDMLTDEVFQGDGLFGDNLGDNIPVADCRPSAWDSQGVPDSPAMSTRSRTKSVAQGQVSPTTPLRKITRKSTSK